MDTCHDHEISYWPDMGCAMCAAQSRIAELEAEVAELKEIVRILAKSNMLLDKSLEDAIEATDTAWNDAIEACKSSILHNVESDKKDNITWVDDRPYICEETSYRKIEALRR